MLAGKLCASGWQTVAMVGVASHLESIHHWLMLLLQGFPSKPRSAADGGLLASADAAEAAKAEELKRGLLGLGFAWVCTFDPPV